MNFPYPPSRMPAMSFNFTIRCSGEKELDLAPIRRLEETEFPGSRAEKDALQRILRTKNDCLEFIKEKVLLEKIIQCENYNHQRPTIYCILQKCDISMGG